MHIKNGCYIYAVILLKFFGRSVRKLQAAVLSRSSRKICHSVRIDIPFSTELTSQFDLANFYRRKVKKTSAKTRCSVDRQVAPYDHWRDNCGVYIYIDCEQNATHQNIGFPRGLQPVNDNHWADIYE